MARTVEGVVEAFAACARSFCELIDSAESLGRGEFVWEAGARLAHLYAAGLALPNETSEGELVDAEVKESEKESRLERQRRLSDKLYDVDSYWTVYDPYDEEGLDAEDVAEYLPADLVEKYRDVLESDHLTEDGIPKPVCSILSDDLMDVYRGMKDGLSLYEGGERESAIWEWRFGFQHGWGIEAVRALTAIHWLTQASGARHVLRDEA